MQDETDRREARGGERVAIRFSVAALLVAVLAGCGASTAASPTTGPVLTAGPGPTVAATPSPDHAKPMGLIAMGHSGITGEGTGAENEALPANSWATGSLPAVNSVYLRLVAALPETNGHVINAGQGGAPASQLPGMAQSALGVVPVPELSIIQTIDSDIKCNGRDAEALPAFGDKVRQAIQLVVDASPNGHVLIVGQLGRPRAEFLNKLVAQVPGQLEALTGSGPCDFFDRSGHLVQKHLDALTAIIDSYEAEQARVCGTFPQCATDGGVRAAYMDTLENFSADWNHLNLRGQAAEAELIWPVVEDLLGL